MIAVVAALADQVVDDPAHHLRADPAPVHGGVEEEVDARAAIARLLLLARLDHAGDRAADEHRVARDAGLVGLREVVLDVAPPALDLRRGADPPQLRGVAGRERPQLHVLHRGDPTGT